MALDSLGEKAQEVASETGFQILTHRLDFFGICPDCRGIMIYLPGFFLLIAATSLP